MAINVAKSLCMRIGPRHSVKCMNIRTVTSREILWCDKIKYLGIDLVSARVFKCSYDNAKCKFYRTFNAIFGKVGRSASEAAIIQLLKTKCLPVLCYSLDVCPINRDQIRSLDYAIHSCFRKKFSTRDQSVVEQCMVFFDCHPVYDTSVWEKKEIFTKNFNVIESVVYDI